MNLAKLNKRVVLQLPEQTSDGMGGFTTEYIDTYPVWAAIWPVSAKQVIANEAITSVTSHRVRIRYRDDVGSDWRIRYHDHKKDDERYFSIFGQPINVDEANEWLDLMCKEVT